jgi:hypothetical protein
VWADRVGERIRVDAGEGEGEQCDQRRDDQAFGLVADVGGESDDQADGDCAQYHWDLPTGHLVVTVAPSVRLGSGVVFAGRVESSTGTTFGAAHVACVARRRRNHIAAGIVTSRPASPNMATLPAVSSPAAARNATTGPAQHAAQAATPNPTMPAADLLGAGVLTTSPRTPGPAQQRPRAAR